MFYCQGHKFETSAEAVKYAFSQVYATPAEKREVEKKLNEGKNASYQYGFSQITIYQDQA